MKEPGQMVRALRLGDTGWALLGAQVQFAPAPDDPTMVVCGVVLVGARDNALVGNSPVATLVHELFRFKQEDAAGVLAEAEKAQRPALSG